jgi:hypothetical protein
MIPKIIWQTHQNRYENLSTVQKNVTCTWKNFNPEWDYRYTDRRQREEDVKQYSDILYECYKMSNNVNQADLWRIIVTYTHGGVYADMDSVCINPLNEIIENYYAGQDMICTSIGGDLKLGPTPEGSVNCANFAAVKNSKILKLILDEVTEKCIDLIETNQTDQLKIVQGVPVWSSFSNITKANKADVLFKDEYCYHNRRFTNYFNPQYDVLYNSKITSYESLCKIMNWPIYYI